MPEDTLAQGFFELSDQTDDNPMPGPPYPGWSRWLVWFSVPSVSLITFQANVQLLNYLIDSAIHIQPLAFAEKATLTAQYVGQVYVFAAASVLAIILAVISGGGALAIARTVLGAQPRRRALWELLAFPVILAVSVFAAFLHLGFYPNTALHILDETLDAALRNAEEGILFSITGTALVISFLSWCLSSTAYSALLLTSPSMSADAFIRMFTRILALTAVPLFGTSLVLSLFYGLGGAMLAEATEALQEQYLAVSIGLVGYYAIMASTTIAATSGYVFIFAGLRTGSLVTLIGQVGSQRALAGGLAVIAPLLPPILGGLSKGLSG